MTRPPDLSQRNIALAPGGFSRAAATFVGLRLAAALASLVTPLARAVDWPGPVWSESSPAAAGMAEAPLAQARDYALTGGGSGVITRHGKIVLAWGDLQARYDLKSSSKSIGVTALGLALADGLVTLDDPAVRHHPAFATPPEGNRDTGWPEHVTLRHLANQTAGFEKPGGYGKLLFAPGTQWHYSDAGPNWLAECLTLRYRRDLNEVLFERVFGPLGIQPADLVWRPHAYRPRQIDGITRREFGSGFSANVHAMARLGYLYLRGGRWRDRQLLPADFVRQVRQPGPDLRGLPEHEPQHGNASDHYSLLWWNNGDGTLPGVPRDAFWSWGLYDSLIVVILCIDIVAYWVG